MNLYAIPPLVSAILFGWAGLFVYSKDAKSRTNRLFLWICLTTVFWQGTWFVLFQFPHPKLILPLIKLGYTSIIFIPVALYHFSVTFLNAEKDKRFLFPAYISGLFFLITLHTTDLYISGYYQYFFGFYPKAGLVLHPVYLIWLTALVGRAIFLLFLSTRETSLSVGKHRQRQLLLIAFCIYTMAAIDFLCNYGVEFYPFGYVFILIALGIIGYAIVAYRLMDIQTVIHKTAMWLTISSLIILPVGGVYLAGKIWLEGISPVAGATVLGIITLLMIPYVRTVQSRIDHLFQRRKYDMQKELQAFIYEISELKGLDELVNKLQTTIASILYTEKTSLILFDVKAEGLNASLVYNLPSPFEIVRHHDFLKWLERENDIVGMDFIDYDPTYAEIRERGKNYFADVQGRLVVPLVHNEKLLGLLNLDQKSNLKSYTDIDLEFLFTLKIEVSIALSNALLYADVRKMSDALQESGRKLTARVKEMEAFTYTISHDLRAPVRALLGYSGILVEEYKDKLDAEGIRIVKVLQQESDYIGNLIDDLLSFSRVGHGEINRVQIDMNGLVRTVVDQLRRLTPARSITVNTLDLPPVLGDPVLLHHVFTNLISNAFKYTSKNKEAVVTIGSQALPRELVYFVADNGVGFDMRYVGKLFSVFQRLHTADEFPGNGVGLAIVHRIIQKHKGRVWAESTLNEGATFYVALPKDENG
jgi:signal transduction histidine kinase